MSPAGRRRPDPIDDPGPSGASRLAVRITAGLTFATLAAAAIVPVVVLRHGGPSGERSGSWPPAAGALHAAAPTDTVRSRQWYLDAMRVPRAWRWSKGKDITVAVLDTGVDGTHRDLTGQVIDGPDYTGGNRRPGGRYWGGHGTAMAGIIAGHGSGPGQSAGVMGIAPRAKILSIRVTWENDDPLRQTGNLAGQSRDAVAKGIRYAVDNGADIINMSLGGGRAFYNGNAVEEEAIQYALSKGVVLVASAGNDGSGPNRKNFPAAYPGVIAVGAVDKRMLPWKDTNRNSYVSVCAPGVDIISPAPGDAYVLGTGTSPSSAIVAGVAALIRSRYPRLTPDQVRQALTRGTVQRSGQNGQQPDQSDQTDQNGQTGTGAQVCSQSLDAVRAMQAAARINKAAYGSPAAEPTPTPVATDEPPAEESDTLLWAVVAGGSAMVVTGLALGWRQRRRSRDEEDDFVAAPPEPVAAAAHVRSAEPYDRKVAPLDWPERPEPDHAEPDHAEPDRYGADDHGSDHHGFDHHGFDRSESDHHEFDRYESDHYGSDRYGSDHHGSDHHWTDGREPEHHGSSGRHERPERSEPGRHGTDRSETGHSGSAEPPPVPALPISESGAWMPQSDLHLPPAKEAPPATPNGNGNGHPRLEPENLRPYDPTGEPRSGAPVGAHARPQTDDPASGFGDDPLFGNPFGRERAVPHDDDAPLDLGRETAVPPEERAPEPPFPEPGFEQPAVPRPETGPPVDASSPTAPFRAVSDQDLAWPVTRSEEEGAAPALRDEEDDLATRAFPAIDPGTAQDPDWHGGRNEGEEQRPWW
ncbi:S8 family serine peptidase [Thermomonospora catenispora]|uniref:S8 family serine peptidase n=1 Tax=Thermomonospora catenispora TaxID=2493090 RepID=UPI00111F529A|nr:S8 family serine peptidase [Thermomonospora catenispora]TNY36676.1 hypothetical protein EIO00_11480 [Thermomonospora catenispora]